ncbi:hypothetical protein SH449x_004250 [Pirellulaceae bacterium SH449]
MNKLGDITSILALVVISTVILCSIGFSIYLLAISTVSLAPMVLNLVAANVFPKSASQVALASSSLLYMVWMLISALDAFVIRPGSLSPLVFVIGPIYSIPAWCLFGPSPFASTYPAARVSRKTKVSGVIDLRFDLFYSA